MVSGRLETRVLVEFLLAVAAGLTIFVFAMAHHAKTSGDRALDHPLRRAMHDIINGKQGIRLHNLWDELDAPRGTLQYHLTVLTHAGKVQAIETPESIRYFTTLSDQDIQDICLLRRGRILDVAVQVKNKPGATQIELLKLLPMSRKVFRDYANLLGKRLLVEEVKDYPNKRYYPTERLQHVLPMIADDEDSPPRGPAGGRTGGGRR